MRGITPDLRESARALRRHATPAERVLWDRLRRRQLEGLKFRRQHAVGSYIIDFFCPEARLGIELDGNHHYEREQHAYDRRRTDHLEAFGYRMLRFSNEEVLNETETVLTRIKEAVWDSIPPSELDQSRS